MEKAYIVYKLGEAISKLTDKFIENIELKNEILRLKIQVQNEHIKNMQ